MGTTKHTLLGFVTHKYGQLSIGIKLLESNAAEAIEAMKKDDDPVKSTCLLMVGAMLPNPCLIAYDKQGSVIHHMHPITDRLPTDLEVQETSLLLDKIRDSWNGHASLPDALLRMLYIGMEKFVAANTFLPYPDDDDSKLDADFASKVNVAAELIGKSIN